MRFSKARTQHFDTLSLRVRSAALWRQTDSTLLWRVLKKLYFFWADMRVLPTWSDRQTGRQTDGFSFSSKRRGVHVRRENYFRNSCRYVRGMLTSDTSDFPPYPPTELSARREFARSVHCDTSTPIAILQDSKPEAVHPSTQRMLSPSYFKQFPHES